MANVARGELWQFSFPKPDHKRPVLVLTRHDMIARLNTVTVAPITSTIRGVPSEVLLDPECGLKHQCVANLHHLVTVPTVGLRTFVGSVSPATLLQVRAAMLFALGFESIGAKPFGKGQ